MTESIFSASFDLLMSKFDSIMEYGVLKGVENFLSKRPWETPF